MGSRVECESVEVEDLTEGERDRIEEALQGGNE